LRGHQSPILKFAVCGKTEQLVSCGMDGSVHRWQISAKEGSPLTKKNWQAGLRDLAVSAAGDCLTFLTRGGQLQCWRFLESGEFSPIWMTDEMPSAKAISVTPDHKLAACLVGNNSVFIYDGET